jgi:hypothetical protein
MSFSCISYFSYTLTLVNKKVFELEQTLLKKDQEIKLLKDTIGSLSSETSDSTNFVIASNNDTIISVVLFSVTVVALPILFYYLSKGVPPTDNFSVPAINSLPIERSLIKNVLKSNSEINLQSSSNLTPSINDGFNVVIQNQENILEFVQKTLNTQAKNIQFLCEELTKTGVGPLSPEFVYYEAPKIIKSIYSISIGAGDVDEINSLGESIVDIVNPLLNSSSCNV